MNLWPSLLAFLVACPHPGDGTMITLSEPTDVEMSGVRHIAGGDKLWVTSTPSSVSIYRGTTLDKQHSVSGLGIAKPTVLTDDDIRIGKMMGDASGFNANYDFDPTADGTIPMEHMHWNILNAAYAPSGDVLAVVQGTKGRPSRHNPRPEFEVLLEWTDSKGTTKGNMGRWKGKRSLSDVAISNTHAAWIERGVHRSLLQRGAGAEKIDDATAGKLAWSQDGKWLIVASHKMVSIFSSSEKQASFSWPGLSGALSAVAAHPSRPLFITGRDNGELSFYCAKGEGETKTIQTEGGIRSVDFIENGDAFAVATLQHLRVYRVTSNACE